MKRKLMTRLESWKTSPNRKPLLLRGARQVGKTWLMREFGRKNFDKVAYINFENNARMQELFKGSFEIRQLVTALQIESQTLITPEDTLVIFDEIQAVPAALTSLKYFQEQSPEYAIIAAGSLLGVALHEGTSFPVGKVEFLDLYPMSFTEFLEATGDSDLLALLESGDWQLISAFKDKYISQLRNYYFLGGMPEVVASFIAERDYDKARNLQTHLLLAYEQDFSKHPPPSDVPRIRLLWQSIPAQLARENKKFFYGAVRTGARAKEFELALQWLSDCGMVYRTPRISKPATPLAAYATTDFKLFALDVGLLGAMCGLDAKSLLEGNRTFAEFKGALTEQYVQQQLISELDIKPCYWSAERAQAEIDFICQIDGEIVPLEVKAEENLHSKSLRSYRDRFAPNHSIRSSMSDYRKDDWLTNLPLYAISQLPKTLTSPGI